MVSQLNGYLLDNNLNETEQSAFKCGNRTKIAILQAKNDIMTSSTDQTVVLILLDVPGTFDTVNHDVLFSAREKLFSSSDLTGLFPN